LFNHLSASVFLLPKFIKTYQNIKRQYISKVDQFGLVIKASKTKQVNLKCHHPCGPHQGALPLTLTY